MSQTKTNYRMIDGSFISPLDFGATGDGAANDATALQNTFDNTTNDIIDLGGKTYAFTSPLTITQSNITIQNGTLKYTGTDNGFTELISVTGSVGSTTYTPSSDIKIGDTSVSFSSVSAFSADTYVVLEGTVEIYSAGFHSSVIKNSEIVRIRKVDSTNNKLILYYPVKGNYKSSEVDVKILTPIENTVFQNVTFEGLGVTEVDLGNNPISTVDTTTTFTVDVPQTGLNLAVNDFFTLEDVTSSTIGGLSNTNFEGKQFQITNVAEAGTTVLTAAAPSSFTSSESIGGGTVKIVAGGTEALALEVCVNTKIINCVFKKCRTSIDISKSFNTRIVNNIFESFAVNGYGIKIEQFTTDTLIEGNTFSGHFLVGVWCLTFETMPKGLIIDNNKFLATRSAAIDVGMIPEVIIRNNSIYSVPYSDFDLSDTTLRGIKSNAFKTICLNNTINGFNLQGIYWEPRYKVVNTSSELSAYSGGYNNTLYSSSNKGQTWAFPSCVISDNDIQGFVSGQTYVAKGIEIAPRSINAGVYGCIIKNNTIKDVDRGINLNSSAHSTPASISQEIKGLDIINNTIYSERANSAKGYGSCINFESTTTAANLGERSIISGNRLETISSGQSNTGQQVDPVVQFGSSSSSFANIKESIITNNLTLNGTYSIYTGSAANANVRFSLLFNNMFSNHSNITNPTYGYGPINATAKNNPIGAPSSTTTPAATAAIQNLADGIVNNFYSNQYNP